MRIAPAAARLEAMNAGREQGRRPFPIVDYCVWCAESGGEVLPGDDVALVDDDEAGLTFMVHAYCHRRGLDWDEREGRVRGLKAQLGWMREQLQEFERLLALAERLRLEDDGQGWGKRLEAAATAIGHADGWLSHAKAALSRFYRPMPPIPGFIETKWRGSLIELVDAGKELQRVREGGE